MCFGARNTFSNLKGGVKMFDDFIMYQKFMERAIEKIGEIDLPEDSDGKLYQNICNKAYSLINHAIDASEIFYGPCYLFFYCCLNNDSSDFM